MKVLAQGLFLSYEQKQMNGGNFIDTLVLQRPRTQQDIQNLKLEPRKIKIEGKIRIDLDAIKRFDAVKVTQNDDDKNFLISKDEALVEHTSFDTNKETRFLAIQDGDKTVLKDIREFKMRKSLKTTSNPKPQRLKRSLGGAGLSISDGIKSEDWRDIEYLDRILKFPKI